MFQEGIEPGTSPTPDCINLKETRPFQVKIYLKIWDGAYIPTVIRMNMRAIILFGRIS